MLLRKGDQAAIRVVAFRKDGFDGEIRLTAAGLPAGVTASDAVIGPGRSTTMLVLTAAAAAPPGTGFLQVAGTAQVAGAAVTRQARFGASSSPPQPNIQPPVAGDGRVVDNLAVCVSAGETAPVAIQAGGGKVWETPRAGIVKIPFTRVGPFAGRLVLTPQDLPPNIGVQQLIDQPGRQQRRTRISAAGEHAHGNLHRGLQRYGRAGRLHA